MKESPRVATGPKKVLTLALVCALACFGMSVTAVRSSAAESKNYIEVQVANFGGCALTSSGSVSCWGSLIDVPMPNKFLPVKHLAVVEDDYACVITESDELKCWWEKQSYYWGGKSHSLPQLMHLLPKNLGPIRQVAFSGAGSACAITTQSTVRCWGESYNESELVLPENIGQATKIDSLTNGYCVLNTAQQLKCWGFKPLSTWRCNFGQDGFISCWDEEGQRSFHSETDLVEDFYSGDTNICVKPESTSTLKLNFCLGSSKNPLTILPSQLETQSDLQNIEVGAHIACAILYTGENLCWGLDYYGGLKVPAVPGGFKSVSVGYWVLCAVSNEGKLYCWGDNRREAGNLRFGPPVRNPAPSIISGQDVGTTGFDFTWKNASSNLQIDSYHIELRLAGGVWKPAKISGISGSIRTLSKLRPNSKYELRVRSKNKAGYSGYSEIHSVKTASICPASMVSKQVRIEKNMVQIKKVLVQSRNFVISARADRVRAQKSIRGYRDYSKLPAMQALMDLRDSYQQKMVIALNSGDIGLAARRASEVQSLDIQISKLLGLYPIILAQIERAIDYESAASSRMQAVAQKLSDAQGELALVKSKCAY